MNNDDNVVVTYDTLYACEVKDIEDKAVERYKKELNYERRRRARERSKIRHEQEEKRRYFLNQKCIGFIICCIFIFLSLIADPVCMVGVLLGIYLMVTKRMAIVNDYWFEHGGANQWDDWGTERKKGGD